MYIHEYINICLPTHAHAYAHAHTHTHQKNTHTHEYTYVYTHLLTYICKQISHSSDIYTHEYVYITYLHTSIACIKTPPQQSTHTYIHTYVYTDTLLYKYTYKITAQRNRPHHAATQLVRTHTCTLTYTHLCLHLFTCVHITSIQNRIAFIKPRPQHFANTHT